MRRQLSKAVFWAGLLLLSGAAGAVFAQSPGEEEPEVEFFFAPKGLVEVGVMEFVGKAGVTQDVADVLADVIAEEISRLGDVRVISRSDIQSMLDLEKKKRLAGCTKYECISEIGGALGMRWMVTGNVAKFGSVYILNLKLSDVSMARVPGRVTRRIRGGEEDLLEEIPGAARELFESVAEQIGLAVEKRVTSASRHSQPISQSPSAITVITREDIEASGATTIPDLLRLVPGMNVIIANPFFTAITARLFFSDENNHFLVLIDGREINFDPLGIVHWETNPISLDDIERIEIIRGPGSALYGANALAGVISIVTRAVPEKASAEIRLDAGEAGRIFSGVNVSTRLGNWGISLGGATDFSGTFLDPRDRSKEVWKFRSAAEYRWSDSGRLMIDLGVAHGSGPMSTPMGTVHSDFTPVSLRLAVEVRELIGQIYYTYAAARADVETPLEYAGIRLATIVPATQFYHVLDGQVQWTLPQLWEPILLIAGGGLRTAWIRSDEMLDAETFCDPTSSRYHEPGISHREIRAGAFIHAEYAMTDWMTVTGGSRIDYNTQTGAFVSPRLAAVIQPKDGQYIRLGVGRSFRKPSFLETHFHGMVEFPDDSPITGPGQVRFQEFMTRVLGNSNLDNEELLAFEAGYVGNFADGRLSIGLDLYCNLYRNITLIESLILEDERGLPDLDLSSVMFSEDNLGLNILGSELTVRYTPSKTISLLASWSHRQVFSEEGNALPFSNPRNQIALGGRVQTDSGLVGSLYAFSRSELWHHSLENPAGLLEPMLKQHVDHVVLVLARLGWRTAIRQNMWLEVGVKLFLPISPFSAPHFGYYEDAGGTTPMGRNYGANRLGRMMTGYLLGSF